MNKYRFVHLSDIHFGQERNGSFAVHEDVREQLLHDCKTVRLELGPASGILVTGDTAFSGKQSEYKKAGEWLDRLSDTVGCSPIEVSVIPGNHDVDQTRIDHVGGIVHEKLRTVAIDKLDGELEGIANGNEENNPLLPKLAAYREFAARYGCDFTSVRKPIWQKEYLLDDPYKVRFVGLNSVQISDRNDKLGNMVLGNNQYVIPVENNVEHVVMVHHPLHWFKDCDLAKQYLKRARVVMVGHEHLLEIRKICNDNDTEFLEIYAGATNPSEPSGLYQYRYNWIELELQSGTNRNNLLIIVHPRVWEPLQTRFVPDSLRLNGQKSKEFLIACPNCRALLSKPSPKAVCETPEAIESTTGKGDSQMTHDESEAFARLRYFFWKYLDWRKRLEILVELDILPSTTMQPVPQTLERLALDSARKQGKLHVLWTAVMKIVPEDKREANPFTS